MTKLRREEFIDRVFSTEWKVAFTQLDPLGHANTASYAQAIVDHRGCLLDEIAKVDSLALLKNEKFGVVFEEMNIKFSSSATFGEVLTINSWIHTMEEPGYLYASGVIARKSDGAVRTLFKLKFRGVDMATGKPRLLPEHVESSAPSSPLAALPTPEACLAQLKMKPHHLAFFQSV